jgi:DNA-binding NarL/FixJ family response regulator
MLNMDKISVAIFGQPNTAQQIIERFETYLDIEPIVSTHDPQILLDTLTQQDIEIVLLEMISNRTEIAGLINHILAHHARAKCIVLAHTLNSLHIQQAVQSGVMGYFLIEPEIKNLIYPVRLAHSGKFTCSREIVCLMLHSHKADTVTYPLG